MEILCGGEANVFGSMPATCDNVLMLSKTACKRFATEPQIDDSLQRCDIDALRFRTMRRLAVEAVGVSKRYGNRDALDGVDLIVSPGALHGLLGPNGAGKTTLMRVLLGLVRRNAGTVRLLGDDLDSCRDRLPRGVAGFVETPAFYPYLSGRQNLSLLVSLDGDTTSDRGERVAQALDEVGLGSEADAAVSGYSAGMRQRLGIAGALLRSPRLLFLDEPTSSLDPAAARHVRALARRLADEGTAVVWSSHDMSEVEELCSTLTVVNAGRVVFSGSVERLRKRAPATVHVLRTSNDAAAISLASCRRGIDVRNAAEDGLEVTADVEALDACVMALAGAGIAVRSLERRTRSLESLFLELTRITTPEREQAGVELGAHAEPVTS
jgi:ABC-2 type transport system ATP-binding protein